MTYTITQSCCKDASCVSVCPVDCIHPTPEEREFASAEILYIDQSACIDCGACADACPAKAIKPLDALFAGEDLFGDMNAEFYATAKDLHGPSVTSFGELGGEPDRKIKVAVVGTGPSASYAARTLLTSTDADVTIIDRLPVPGGLVRSGVAPDHPRTKHVANIFGWTYNHPRTRMYMNVEVGKDVSHDDLLKYHDAVIYGVGARRDTPLGVPGEDLKGVYPGPQVVGWYGGDLKTPADAVDLRTDRVIVVGNGNVALDIGRLLLTDVQVLRHTDMTDHAIAHLAEAGIREVVLLGRRGPDQAAFTRPELLTLPDGIELVVADDEQTSADLDAPDAGSKAQLLAKLPRVSVDWQSAPPADSRRLVLAFGKQVVSIEGEGHNGSARVAAVNIAPTDQPDNVVRVPCGSLVRATGHRGEPIVDLPFDEAAGVVPNHEGRVIDPATGDPVRGAYVVGWIKRGANGGIGLNRLDAHETVVALTVDAAQGRLRAPGRPLFAFGLMLRRKVPGLVTRRRMHAIDNVEVSRGRRQGRPRVKYASAKDMLSLK